jgi:beta-lactam-binding protein with PASTA domain
MFHFFRFLFSRTFFWQIILIFIFLSTLLFIAFYGLSWHTRQGNFIEVPNLNAMTIKQAQEFLYDKSLSYEVIDSARFNPNYLPFAVIEQTPMAGDLVKEDRKIYLTLNPSNYNLVILPDVIQITRRSAESTLRAVGLEIGEVSYIDNIGKEMVLQLRYNNAPIAPEDKLPKNSRVDLVLGNGDIPEY